MRQAIFIAVGTRSPSVLYDDFPASKERHGVPAQLSPEIDTPKISSMAARDKGSALVADATSRPS
jgi:hypothetical protein